MSPTGVGIWQITRDPKPEISKALSNAKFSGVN